LRAAKRGGNWNNGANARAGFYLNLNNAPSDRNINIGFRAALSHHVRNYKLNGFIGSTGDKGANIPVSYAGKNMEQWCLLSMQNGRIVSTIFYYLRKNKIWQKHITTYIRKYTAFRICLMLTGRPDETSGTKRTCCNFQRTWKNG
jgi:hypothetical protein